MAQDADRVRAYTQPQDRWRLDLTDYRSGVGLCVGGPALIYYVSPTEEELFKVCIGLSHMK